MTVHLVPGAAELCVQACENFIHEVRNSSNLRQIDLQAAGSGAFPTARQIGAVYSLFANDDLQSLLNGFVAQAEAMAGLFAAAGG